MLLEERHTGDQGGNRVVLIHLGNADRVPRLRWPRPPTSDRQIDGVSQIAFGGEPAGDVFEMRVEAAVLVNDQHDGRCPWLWAAPDSRRSCPLAIHKTPARSPAVHRPARTTAACHIVLQDRQQRHGRGTGAGDLGEGGRGIGGGSFRHE